LQPVFLPCKAGAALQHRLDERTGEFSKALDQQIAIAEVLQVINPSPGDLEPSVLLQRRLFMRASER